MRSLSPQLTELLKRLDLCTDADLRACTSHVRRLARDLPAFDSVWVDALVQLRRLTPYQGEVLLSDEPEQLNAGPCVLVDKLGRHDSSHTFLARRRGSEDRCVVKFVDPDRENFERIAKNLEQLSEVFRQFSHHAIAGPHASLAYDERLVAVSRFVPGASIRDTLIQTGRFQANDVIEIGRQLLSGLAGLERHWLAHGDIRIANLRLDVDGTACLVNCGIAVAAERRFIVHQQLRPDRCDTVAPELIGTNRTPDAQSDLYALGCLLWQLLCGRPPFPCADPLEKLASHQTRSVPDVREIAPHTPAWLATAIAQMTHREPTRRPPSFSDADRRWSQHTTDSKRGPDALSRFSPRIREMARRSSAPRQASNWMLVAIALIVVSGIGLVLTNTPAGESLLASATATEPDRTALVGDTGTSSAPKSLPAPDANGVIVLPDRGPWLATRLDSPGPLTIRGLQSALAVVSVAEPWAINADSVTLEGVAVVGGNVNCLIHCTSRAVRMSRVVLVGRKVPVGLKWASPDGRDRSAGRITMTDSMIRGVRAGVELNSVATDVNIGNVLLAGGRSAVRVAKSGSAGQNTTFRMVNVTTRRMAHLIENVLPENGRSPAHIDLLLADSVFSLDGQNAAVVAFIGPALPDRSNPVVETGSNPDTDASLMSSNARVAIWVNSTTGQLGEVPEHLVLGDDLMPSPLKFRGEQFDGKSSELTEFEAPRLSRKNPGVRASSLPQ